MQTFITLKENINGNDYVVGDIHGQYSRLIETLKVIGFDQSKDRLFSVGDLVDRGPENELILTELVGQPWFFPVKGNHELMITQIFQMSNEELKDPETRKNIIDNGGTWFLFLDKHEQMFYSNIVVDLPVSMEIVDDNGNVLAGFVHADVPSRSWSEWRSRLQSGTETEKQMQYALWAHLPAINESRRAYPITDCKHVFVGHNTFHLSNHLPPGIVNGGLVMTDSGGWKSGNSKNACFMIFDALTGKSVTPENLLPDWNYPVQSSLAPWC